MTAAHMLTAFPKIAIVGSGAIGCYYGARLVRAGQNVHFLMRSDLATVRERGLNITLPEEKFHLPPSSFQSAATPAEIGPVDLVIVGLKTTADSDFKKLISPLLHPATAILTLQNGLGADEQLAADFGPERILGGLCFICVNRLAPGEISCLQPGALSLGEYQRPMTDRVRAIAAMFANAGVKCAAYDNLMELRWKKLVWNIPFNGLSIVAGSHGSGLTTDQILADSCLEGEVRALMYEVTAAAAVHGFTIPASFVEKQIESTRPMGPYKPSSLIDYREGREVEVESIWGEPLRRAQAKGVSTPRLAMLYALLKSTTAR